MAKPSFLMIYRDKRNLFSSIFYNLYLYILMLLSASVIWCGNHFGNISINEIMFTLNMPLEGAPDEYFKSYFLEAFLSSLAGYIILKLVSKFLKTIPDFYIIIKCKVFKFKSILKFNPLSLPEKRFKYLPLAAWLCLIIIVMNSNYQLFDYIKSCIQASAFIENEYVSIKEINIDFPEEKKNVICIFVESAETTFQDEENGGVFDENIIPEMTAIAKNNISFSQSERLEGAAVAPGTGWTIAGLTAQTAGIPLKIYANGSQLDNRMGKYEYFLPGAISIGEVLEQQGYHNFFMAGSDFSYGGRKNYFTQHGNYEIFDYYSAIEEGKISSDYKKAWGFEDRKLYEYAKEKITDLAKEERPFHFAMLTVDTHGNGGDDTMCELCPDRFEETYMNVWACASAQLSDFIDWLQKQDFYEETVIYIAGDHASMQTGDFLEDYVHDVYDKHNGSTDRNVYNVFINSVAEPVETKNRKFTTLDLCPSILGALGADIEGNRIGLGTNLFSEEQTLAEIYGYEAMFEELGKRSSFYNREILYP